MCKEKEKNKGFSLVELLVCVTILAIISIPLLNSFLVADRTNEKAKTIQRTTTLAQNIMETVKSQSLSKLRTIFASSNLAKLNLSVPYDITNSYTTVQEDPINGKYEYCIKRVKEGNKEYDVYITLDAALYKNAMGSVQNNYQMPSITNLQGSKIAVIDPDGYSATWNSYVDAGGNTIYTKDTSSNMDNAISTYFYNLHLAYIDYLTMQKEVSSDDTYIVPNPYTLEQIMNYITKETTVVATNGTNLDGSTDTSVVNIISKIEYSIDGSYHVTGETQGLHTEYQIFSKTFKTTDGTNSLEQIYLFYNKSNLIAEDAVVIKNHTVNVTEFNLVGQSAGVVKLKCYDPANSWKLASNVSTVIEGGKVVGSELISSDAPIDRLFEVKVEVYQTDLGIRTGKKYAELLSTKGE